MKYLKALSQLSVFTLADATRIIGNLPATKKYVKSMVGLGYVRKIRRNLYTCLNFSDGSDVANRFQIASNINENSYVSYHSAFEFYGFYDQVYFQMQVSSPKRFSSFDYDGYSYVGYMNGMDKQIEIVQGIKVTSLERTIVDSVDMLGKVMDAEELVKCIDLIGLVDESKIIEILEAYDKEVLYRKVGYVLSLYKDDLRLSEGLFELCKNKGVVANHGNLVGGDKTNLLYNSEWGLNVYPNMRQTPYKGGNVDV